MAVIDITDENYKVELSKKDKAVIKFYADWCGSCRLINPKFKRIAEEEKYKDFAFLNTNAEKNPELRKWVNVTSLPFFAVIKNGEIIIADCQAKEEKLLEMINQAL